MLALCICLLRCLTLYKAIFINASLNTALFLLHIVLEKLLYMHTRIYNDTHYSNFYRKMENAHMYEWDQLKYDNAVPWNILQP